MLARTPSNLLRDVRLQPPPVRKLSRHRRIAIRDVLAEIMRTVEPTPFAAEAPSRHGLRVALVLDGWRWPEADNEASLLVASALQFVGAKRPTHMQGQPEYTQDGHVPRTRERCAKCGKPLPEGNYKYCGPVCAIAAKYEQRAKRDPEEREISARAARAAYISRLPARECPACAKSFKPRRYAQTYCTARCADVARRAARRREVPVVSEAVLDE
jgi:predicted nucleic acid-binding Zn ribbon protein